MTMARPTVLTATEASRNFAAVLERADHGESFTVVRNHRAVARIVPPEEPKPNGAALLAFLETWEPDPDGFTDEILAALDAMGEPQERDQERLAWIDDYR